MFQGAPRTKLKREQGTLLKKKKKVVKKREKDSRKRKFCMPEFNLG